MFYKAINLSEKRKPFIQSFYWINQVADWFTYAVILLAYVLLLAPLPFDKISNVFITETEMIALTIAFTLQIKKIASWRKTLNRSIFFQALNFFFTTLFTSLTFCELLVFYILRIVRFTNWNIFQFSQFHNRFFFIGLIFSLAFIIWHLIYFAFRYIQKARREELTRFYHEKELLELEAKSLRAQMNPHFIFNCLNSIKSLIQDNRNMLATDYLTTFSKLIRTLFNNSDKKEISLHDEIETCRLYLELEMLRFDNKLTYAIGIEPGIDLKSIQVPALILQPFIENAIWHGIVPGKKGGHINILVNRKTDIIEVLIDDNGIGREASRQSKSSGILIHQSKGVQLAESRLRLKSLINNDNSSLRVIDKKDEKGSALGTSVILTFKF